MDELEILAMEVAEHFLAAGDELPRRSRAFEDLAEMAKEILLQESPWLSYGPVLAVSVM